MSLKGRSHIIVRGAASGIQQLTGHKGLALINPIISTIMYGYLYNYHAVEKYLTESDEGYNIAPTGWRVPDFDDGKALEDYVTANYSGGWGDHVISDRVSPLPHPRNSTGRLNTLNFHAFTFGSLRTIQGTSGGNDGTTSCWWLVNNPVDVKIPIIWWKSWSTNTDIFRYIDVGNENTGMYVRCVRDATGAETSLNDGEACDPAVDIDGNIYNTVKIGTQVWMVQNLATSKYRNGETIPNLISNTDWANDTGGARCAYDNNEAWVFGDSPWLT
jgi:uncharacterized protein (TIGR02145 family)